MTIEERILFIRAGYSAQDIKAFEEAESGVGKHENPKPDPAADPKPDPAADPKPDPAADPKPDPAADPKPDPAADPKQDDMPAWATALVESVKNLTAAQQKANIRFDDMGEPDTVEKQALDALGNYLTGGKTK